MTLQKKITTLAVTGSSVSTGLTITFSLMCWNEGDNPEIDEAVINQIFQGYVKIGISGKTTEELLTETVKIIKEDMQNCIDKYKREQELLANVILETARSWLETNVEG